MFYPLPICHHNVCRSCSKYIIYILYVYTRRSMTSQLFVLENTRGPFSVLVIEYSSVFQWAREQHYNIRLEYTSRRSEVFLGFSFFLGYECETTKLWRVFWFLRLHDFYRKDYSEIRTNLVLFSEESVGSWYALRMGVIFLICLQFCG